MLTVAQTPNITIACSASCSARPAAPQTPQKQQPARARTSKHAYNCTDTQKSPLPVLRLAQLARLLPKSHKSSNQHEPVLLSMLTIAQTPKITIACSASCSARPAAPQTPQKQQPARTRTSKHAYNCRDT